MGNGPAGYGQGGQPNAYPSRGLAEYGTNPNFRDMPNDWVGGARGPAALPSRATVWNGPAPSTLPAHGANGPVSVHRGAFIEDAGAPRLSFDNVLLHKSIPWNRPVYANAAGRMGYHPATRMSWTANSIDTTEGPRSPIPVQTKRIGNFTVRKPFGDTGSGMLFRNGSLAQFVASIQVGMDSQGRRWLSQAKTRNPWQPNLSNWGPAGSYGQTTRTLQTQPANIPTSYTTYGAY